MSQRPNDQADSAKEAYLKCVEEDRKSETEFLAVFWHAVAEQFKVLAARGIKIEEFACEFFSFNYDGHLTDDYCRQASNGVFDSEFIYTFIYKIIVVILKHPHTSCHPQAWRGLARTVVAYFALGTKVFKHDNNVNSVFSNETRVFSHYGKAFQLPYKSGTPFTIGYGYTIMQIFMAYFAGYWSTERVVYPYNFAVFNNNGIACPPYPNSCPFPVSDKVLNCAVRTKALAKGGKIEYFIDGCFNLHCIFHNGNAHAMCKHGANCRKPNGCGFVHASNCADCHHQYSIAVKIGTPTNEANALVGNNCNRLCSLTHKSDKDRAAHALANLVAKGAISLDIVKCFAPKGLDKVTELAASLG